MIYKVPFIIFLSKISNRQECEVATRERVFTADTAGGKELRTQGRRGPSQLGPWGALVPRVQEAEVNQHYPHPVGGEGL